MHMGTQLQRRRLTRAILRRRLKRPVRAAAWALTALAASLTSANAQNFDALADNSSNTNQTLSQTGQVVLVKEADQRELEFANKNRTIPAWSPNPLGAGQGYLYFVADAPLTWNTNPALVSTSAKDSWRSDPKLQLDAAFQTSVLQASLQSTGDLDRYFSDPGADTNGVQSTAKLSLNCASGNTAGLCKPGSIWAKHIIPYFLYQSTLKYSADFGVLKANLNDVGAGLTFDSAGLGLCDPDKAQNGKPLCPNHSGAYPYENYGLDIQATRRYANTGGDSDSVIVKPSVTENFTKDLAISFQPNFRMRWFDTIGGFSRQDETLTLPAAVAWDPPILPFLHPEIRISANFVRAWSNVDTKAYRQWDVGPLIELIAVPAGG
jgi:hypothetical protein